MSGNTHAYNQFQSAQGGHAILTDPGTGNTLDLKGKSGAFVKCTGVSTVTLPDAPAGVTLTLYAITGTVTVADTTGSIVDILADDAGYFVSVGEDIGWVGLPTVSHA